MSGTDATSNTQALTPGEQLSQMITQMEQDGVTLELIVAMVMSNPEGVGAMDICSDNIAGITNQSNILSKVQSDVITIDSILSKIESQLGTASRITQGMWSKAGITGAMLTSLKNAYNDLFIGNASNAGGASDLKVLQGYESQYPSLKPVISGITQGLGADFGGYTDPTTGQSVQGQSINGHFFGKDLQSWTGTQWAKGSSQAPTGLIGDVVWLAEQHYDANHPTGSSSTTPSDPLSNWWSDGNEAQTLCSGQSQSNTTEVQSLMQLLQGFDSTAQQDIQLASSQKSIIIKNEIAS